MRLSLHVNFEIWQRSAVSRHHEIMTFCSIVGVCHCLFTVRSYCLQGGGVGARGKNVPAISFYQRYFFGATHLRFLIPTVDSPHPTLRCSFISQVTPITPAFHMYDITAVSLLSTCYSPFAASVLEYPVLTCHRTTLSRLSTTAD